MNSPFANIFLAVQDRIRDAVPAVKYIDQDLGQLRAAKPAVAWPCVLIDFEDFSFEDYGTLVQSARGNVVLTLGFAPQSNSSQATPGAYVQQALSYYDMEWALHVALQGWTPGGDIGRLKRTSARTLKRNDNYRVREVRYSLAFDDYSTKQTMQLANAAIVVSEELG